MQNFLRQVGVQYGQARIQGAGGPAPYLRQKKRGKKGKGKERKEKGKEKEKERHKETKLS